MNDEAQPTGSSLSGIDNFRAFTSEPILHSKIVFKPISCTSQVLFITALKILGEKNEIGNVKSGNRI